MKNNIVLILVCFIIFILPSANASNKCTDYKSMLKLSEKQIKNIEQSEKQYNSKIAKLNAEIILRKMEASQLKGVKSQQARVDSINAELNILNDKINEIQEQKEEAIITNLRLIQRFRYRRYCI